jgi:hypothetical protein
VWEGGVEFPERCAESRFEMRGRVRNARRRDERSDLGGGGAQSTSAEPTAWDNQHAPRGSVTLALRVPASISTTGNRCSNRGTPEWSSISPSDQAFYCRQIGLEWGVLTRGRQCRLEDWAKDRA